MPYSNADEGPGKVVPMLRPSRVDGWKGLSEYLQMIGIAVTANAQAAERSRAIELGMNECIAKPYQAETMILAMANCLP